MRQRFEKRMLRSSVHNSVHDVHVLEKIFLIIGYTKLSNFSIIQKYTDSRC